METLFTCLGICPLDYWWNGTPFWPLTLVCSSKGSGDAKSCVNHVLTHEEHVSRVWDHHHWITDKILTCLHVTHMSVVYLEAELEIVKNIEHCPIPKRKHVSDTWRTCAMCMGPCSLDSQWISTPFWPLTLVCSSMGSGVTKLRVNHVSTRKGHVSRV